ncbi:MAG: DALR anticodon-binding domain-containing protein, partial [Candidatus Saccharimonadales bacterium]
GKVFKESDGAIVYEGEKVGLHTRVFITGKGLPTYEAKDLGLTELKAKDYPDAALSIVITAHEQSEYFKVMLAALAEVDPATAKKTKHLSHGFVSLSSGKMSSRTGDVYHAVTLLADVKAAAEKLFPGTAHDIQVGAVKYEFAKHRLGGGLVYDVAESVSLEGNSGPYLQYAHARACSILRKADKKPGAVKAGTDLEAAERTLARKISQYPEAVDKAVTELMPHHVCTYLYELAQAFNRFYEGNRVVGDPRQDLRLALVGRYGETLKSGLRLLGIAAPDKM